jgi:hypothetical protein
VVVEPAVQQFVQLDAVERVRGIKVPPPVKSAYVLPGGPRQHEGRFVCSQPRANRRVGATVCAVTGVVGFCS